MALDGLGEGRVRYLKATCVCVCVREMGARASQCIKTEMGIGDQQDMELDEYIRQQKHAVGLSSLKQEQKRKPHFHE